VRAVWSYWSKPFATRTSWPWREPVHHLLAWGLSLRLARSHYPDTVLVTDTPGRALLVDELGLTFGSVCTALDELTGADPAFWMLGKLLAYSLQDEPFVHLDTDVFLWRPLPPWLVASPVFAQHRDDYSVTDGCGPRVIEEAFASHGLALPAEWQWFRSLSARSYHEANCGVLGGTNPGLLREYARLALDLARNPANAGAWATVPDLVSLNPTVEQFVLSACVDYHRFSPGSDYRGSHIRYLFPSAAHAWDADYARRVGYTHLVGPAKQHPRTMDRLAARVRAEDPDFYARCEAATV
jgi:hypothetical protein